MKINGNETRKYPNIFITSPVNKAASYPPLGPKAKNAITNDNMLTIKKAKILAPNNILNGTSLFAGQIFA